MEEGFNWYYLNELIILFIFNLEQFKIDENHVLCYMGFMKFMVLIFNLVILILVQIMAL